MFVDKKYLAITKTLLIRILIILGLSITGEIFFLVKSSKAQTQTVPPSILMKTNTVKKIEFIGNTVFPDSELEKLLASYQGRNISLELLEKIKQEIDFYYLNQGYRSSGSFLPQQKLQDGVVSIQIIEAILESIQIEGQQDLSENYLKSRLPKEGKPLNYNHLLKALERLQNDPLIQKLNGTVEQSSLGKNVLLLEIEEHLPWYALITATNGYSRSIGALGVNIKVAHQNVFGFGDRLTLDSSLTDGLARFGGSYSFPINKLDGRIILAYNNANSKLTEDIVSDLGIEADYQSFRLDFQQPIISTSIESLSLGWTIEYIDSETFVLGNLSFPFTEGLEDGQSKVTVLRFSQEYVKDGATTVLAVQSQFSVGIDLFDATITETGIDGSFWHWNGNLEWLKAFTEERDIVLATRVFFQLTPDNLLPIEQFTMGGLNKVMGYRPNLGVADNGVIGTVELRIPLIKGENWGEIKIIPFFHLGNIWNNFRETTGSNTFASSGLGLRYRFKEAFEARIDYGLPIIKLSGFGETDTEDNFSFYLRVYPLKF